MPHAIGIINRHVCSGVMIKAERPELEENKKEDILAQRDSILEAIEAEMLSGNNDISLDINGLIIEGKCTKIDKDSKRITIKDSFNQYHVVTFDGVKKYFSLF